VPSAGIDEAVYGQSQAENAAVSQQVGYVALPGGGRQARDQRPGLFARSDFPSLGRVFDKKTIFGDKVKHVNRTARDLPLRRRHRAATSTAWSASTKPTC